MGCQKGVSFGRNKKTTRQTAGYPLLPVPATDRLIAAGVETGASVAGRKRGGVREGQRVSMGEGLSGEAIPFASGETVVKLSEYEVTGSHWRWLDVTTMESLR